MKFSMGFEGGGVGGRDPKSNISRFQISRGWHLCPSGIKMSIIAIKWIQIVGFQLKEVNLLLKISDVLILNVSNFCIGRRRSCMFST